MARRQLVDPARWWIMERDGQSCSWLVRQQLVDWMTDCPTQSSSVGKWSLKPLIENTCGGWGSSGRSSQPHRIRWRDPQGPKLCTSPPTREPAPEGPSLIVGIGVKYWNPEESEAGAIAPSRPLPHAQCHSTATSVTPPRGTPKAPPLYVTGAPRQKKWPKWKNRSKLQKKYN